MPFFSDPAALVPFANAVAVAALLLMGAVGGFYYGKRRNYERGFREGEISARLPKRQRRHHG